jgi:hypothetical protein
MGFDGTYYSSAFILSTSPPGKFSGLPSRYLSTDIFISTSQPCPMGTQRDTTSWGPCLICPPNMKSGSGMTCEPCSTTNKSTRCFRAAIEEIEMENLTSHTQAYRYPESSDFTEYDDLLLSNIFQLSTVNVRCLLLSPVFWAIIGCLIGLLLVQVFCCCLKRKMAPLLLLDFFSRSNRLKTGQIYARVFLGICFAIFMIFLGIFSLAFAHRYPMERTTIDQWRSAFCDPTLVNSKFSSSLQLLAQLKSDEEKVIFDLLDHRSVDRNRFRLRRSNSRADTRPWTECAVDQLSVFCEQYDCQRIHSPLSTSCDPSDASSRYVFHRCHSPVPYRSFSDIDRRSIHIAAS